MSIVPEDFDRFLRAWPEFEATRALDDLRAREFPMLDAGSHVYLDYTGAGLYGASQISATWTCCWAPSSATPIPATRRRSTRPTWWSRLGAMC